MLKFFLAGLLGMTSLSGWTFTKGYNQAWLKNAYRTQWLNSSYDPQYVAEIMRLNREGGSSIIRMWLYEGATLNQFIYDETKDTIKLRPELIQNLIHFLKAARKSKLKVNLTFLDANAFKDLEATPKLRRFWWNVFNDKYGKQHHFYQEAILPVYQLIATQFKDVVTQVDLVNEVNAIGHFKMFSDSKNAMSKFLCKLGSNRPVPITASLGWGNAEEFFFSGLLNESCLDFYDIHFYNDLGKIPRCQDFKRFASRGYQFQLGEFGQKSKAYDDELQSLVTLNFLKNAQSCGFLSALAWRLDDNRDGYNAEARHSYLSFGTPRKAYQTLRDFH
ncbi:MAG: hypothetical protein H0V66_15185 [Bdellovibrionales bacterium]|nr:hypothetical protein [Bdellovibrionales bacterium]